RTGDTPQADRERMRRRPPHILVTTPESLYILLGSQSGRGMLGTARTVIVDEIHAVIGTRRGAHLALSLERLQKLATGPLHRVGLSATQKPIEEVARYLSPNADCAIVDEGHRRAMDITIEMPRSAVETVMANEVWEEYYARLAQLIAEHRTTLVFVNTRRMAERAARHLADIIGEDAVTAHHGSLSKEKRLDAESRLKSGQLKALVATASLELGIDIGHVDLVCQIGSPHRIATFLQRVGRSGHTVSGMPKGRLFPISKDDLVECAALLRAVSRGDLDCIVSQDAPLDVLAQQIVAESACDDYAEDDLFALVRRAYPYRNLQRSDFDAVVRMVNEGFATKNGRRGALVHRDEVNGRVRARRGSRMTAITNGGAIPEVADYRVMLEPGDTFIGTLNEDFAIESNAGDIFQLGNASWQILQVGSGVVRVADAKGAPPSIPFWLGEAPARSDELSRAVSDLRADMDFSAVPKSAAEEIKSYFDGTRRILGLIPTQEAIVAERFFDESGGMQLIIHAPFGSRINRAWGLALRKRFCRQFNFELQAAATEDAILLSLGPQHSFPLADVFHYLHPATARDVLVQAFLDAPVFQTRWRWNTTISLAIPRNRHGKRVPPPLQRAMADDLMAAVFPDAAACFENIRGDRELPDHPLVNQTVRDCLSEAMDFDGLARVLDKIHRGEIQCVAVDTVEPSPLANDIINARPFQFLDDAPLEERRTQAVYTGRSGILDDSAIERVREEARPDPRDADELHDALLSAGFLLDGEFPREMMEQLTAARRAGVVDPSSAASRHLLPASGEKDSGERLSPRVNGEKDSAQCPSPRFSGKGAAEGRVRGGFCVAAERLPEMLAVHPQQVSFAAPPSRIREWTREEAIVELLRGRLTIVGPVTIGDLAQSLQISDSETEQALIKLESEGVVLRTNGNWCDRRLLARIHRYTLNRLRAEIEPLSPSDFMRFLFAWQHVAQKLSGVDGLRKIVAQLEGYEVPASAWEKFILPARMDRFDVSTLDTLCLTGEVGWAKLTTGIGIFPRDHATAWLQSGEQTILSVRAQEILDQLRTNGASFLQRD
ncbi:MAG TPA: helicase-related protein, partial [Thermoanaerobaculia bacterium]|nr:helicase-related protein [Thermoanaerobaculia bacterium]